jgi:hypothetical protein
MLVQLQHGMCVNPEIVKLVHIRQDRQQKTNSMVYTVVIKTDEDGFLVLASVDDRAEAEELTRDTARRINKGLGEEDADEDDDEDAVDAADDDDDDDDEDDDDDGGGDDQEDDDDGNSAADVARLQAILDEPDPW